MKFHVFVHDPGSERTLTAILNSLSTLNAKVQTMFEDLQAQVQKITDADEAMKVVLIDIKTKLDNFRANSNLSSADATKLAAISSAIAAEADSVIAATVANTDAAPPPTP